MRLRVCLVLACAASSCGGSSPFSSSTVVSKLVELGAIQDAEHPICGSVSVSNDSSFKWPVQDVKTSCGCLTVNSFSRNVEPGGMAVIAYQLEPRGLQGSLKQELTGLSPTGRLLFRVDLEAMIIPHPFSEPSWLEFHEPGYMTEGRILAAGSSSTITLENRPRWLEVHVLDEMPRSGYAVRRFRVTRNAMTPSKPSDQLTFRVESDGETQRVSVPVFDESALANRLSKSRVIIVHRIQALDRPSYVDLRLPAKTMDYVERIVVQPTGFWRICKSGSKIELWPERETIAGVAMIRVLPPDSYERILYVVPY